MPTSKSEYLITKELFDLINHLDANASLSLMEKAGILNLIRERATALGNKYAILALEHFFTPQDQST